MAQMISSKMVVGEKTKKLKLLMLEYGKTNCRINDDKDNYCYT